MKKILLILLCVPLMFSCGEKDTEKEKDNINQEEQLQIIDTTFYNGDRYVGEWKDHKYPRDGWQKYHGKGTYTWGSGRNKGDKYVGEWRNGERHGLGIYTFADGATYKGEYTNNYRNGQGTFTYPYGKTKEGLWRNDEFIGEEYVKKEKAEENIKKEKKKEEQEEVEIYEEEEESYYGVINDPDGYTNVREGKSSKSEIVFKVYEGEEFEIIDNSDDNWWLIEYDGEQGYIYSDRIDIIK